MNSCSNNKKLLSAVDFKEEGNLQFKNNNFEAAVKLYGNAIECTREESAEKAVYYKNRAAAHIKLKNYELAVKDADAALEILPKDPKALFRRCQALEYLERLEDEV